MTPKPRREDPVEPDPVRVYIDTFAALVNAWDAVPEDERIGLIPPPSPTCAQQESEAYGLQHLRDAVTQVQRDLERAFLFADSAPYVGESSRRSAAT